jgi:RNase adaptor protein for sRNA GlmZ degradation
MSAAFKYGFEKKADLVQTLKSIPNEAYHYFLPNLAAGTDAYYASKARQALLNDPSMMYAQMQQPSYDIQQPIVHHRHYRHHTQT